MNKNNINANLESYKKYFTDNAFWDLVKREAKSIGRSTVKPALTLYYMYKDGLDIGDKLLVLGALGYLILPADLLPDAIPMFGFTDDAAAIGYVFSKLKNKATKEIKEKVEEKISQWFDKKGESSQLNHTGTETE